MKKKLIIFIVAVVTLLGLFFVLNIEVTTKQGVNYVLRPVKIPLYLKVLNFFDRHYNYAELAKRIVKDVESDREKVFKIFYWVKENIKEQPDNLPVIDDHVWHIIVRGYGVPDQYSDVFTTLCNYVGVDAFFLWVFTKDKKEKMPLSFVKLDNEWRVFDPYNQIYFNNKEGDLISITDIRSGETWVAESSSGSVDVHYRIYLDNIPLIKDIGLRRANVQSPLNRLRFEIAECFSKKER